MEVGCWETSTPVTPNLGYSTASTFRERINRTVDENMMRMEIEKILMFTGGF